MWKLTADNGMRKPQADFKQTDLKKWNNVLSCDGLACRWRCIQETCANLSSTTEARTWGMALLGRFIEAACAGYMMMIWAGYMMRAASFVQVSWVRRVRLCSRGCLVRPCSAWLSCWPIYVRNSEPQKPEKDKQQGMLEPALAWPLTC